MRVDFSRLARRWRMFRSSRTDPLILMYHRVAEPSHDPWNLCVSPENFYQQMDVLARHRQVVPLGWLVSELSERRLPSNVAVVTFDDAYHDVFVNGFPILRKWEMHATMFVPTGFIDDEVEFWWDSLARVLLGAPALPFFLETEPTSSGPVTTGGKARSAVLLEVWVRLRDMDMWARRAALTAVLSQIRDAPPAESVNRPMTSAELREMSANPLIELGDHTVSHPSLPTLTPEGVRHELSASSIALQALTGAPVRSFAYPFGDLDRTTPALVRSAGYACAVTTEPFTVGAGTDLFALPRYQVENWSPADFLHHLPVSVT